MGGEESRGPQFIDLQIEISGIGDGNPITVSDFWRWGYSDLLSNRNRSILAEFIVASALGATGSPRLEWDATDIRYHEKNIEVKSSAYCQSWPTEKPSKIIFQIGEKQAWDARTNSWISSPSRVSHCYVFCVYTEMDCSKARRNILDLSHWKFYLALTKTIDQHVKKQKTISLGSLKNFALGPIDIGELKKKLDSLLEISNSNM